jgi:hypothetical protein
MYEVNKSLRRRVSKIEERLDLGRDDEIEELVLNDGWTVRLTRREWDEILGKAMGFNKRRVDHLTNFSKRQPKATKNDKIPKIIVVFLQKVAVNTEVRLWLSQRPEPPFRCLAAKYRGLIFGTCSEYRGGLPMLSGCFPGCFWPPCFLQGLRILLIMR